MVIISLSNGGKGIRYFENNIYPISLVLTNNFDDLSNNYVDGETKEELHENKDAEATTYMMTRKTNDYHAMAVGICFNVPITAKLAAHEGFHAAHYMLAMGVHIPLSNYSDEAWAYLIGWIAECIEDYRKA